MSSYSFSLHKQTKKAYAASIHNETKIYLDIKHMTEPVTVDVDAIRIEALTSK
jgi:hypothetical protein